MANTYIATDAHGITVAEFRSTDYDPDMLVATYGRVTVYDQTDSGRFVTAIRPKYIARMKDGTDIVRAEAD